MMEKCFETIKEYAKGTNLSIAIPYKIGCGIANGDWDIVSKIIDKVFGDSIVVYKLDEKNNKK